MYSRATLAAMKLRLLQDTIDVSPFPTARRRASD
jgi:hypothetical protein